MSSSRRQLKKGHITGGQQKPDNEEFTCMNNDSTLPLSCVIAMFIVLDGNHQEIPGESHYQRILNGITAMRLRISPDILIAARHIVYDMKFKKRKEYLQELTYINVIENYDIMEKSCALMQRTQQPWSSECLVPHEKRLFKQMQFETCGGIVGEEVLRREELYRVKSIGKIGLKTSADLSVQTSDLKVDAYTDPIEIEEQPKSCIEPSSPWLAPPTDSIKSQRPSTRTVSIQSHIPKNRVKLHSKKIPEHELASRLRLFNHLPFANIKQNKKYRKRFRNIEQKVFNKVVRDVQCILRSSILSAINAHPKLNTSKLKHGRGTCLIQPRPPSKESLRYVHCATTE